MIRPVEELQTVTDCVEEVLYVVKETYAMASLVVSNTDAERAGYDLYDRIEAIVKRAQELPRVDAPGSQVPK